MIISGETLVQVEVLADARVALVRIDVLHPPVDVLVDTKRSLVYQRPSSGRTVPDTH